MLARNHDDDEVCCWLCSLMRLLSVVGSEKLGDELIRDNLVVFESW